MTPEEKLEVDAAYKKGYADAMGWKTQNHLEHLPPQPVQQKPTAYINIEKRRLEWATPYVTWDTPTCINLDRIPLYQPREWVGLTPQERDEINEKVYGAVPHHVAFHHAIEKKLKEKNHG
jgi:hypothetical protein